MCVPHTLATSNPLREHTLCRAEGDSLSFKRISSFPPSVHSTPFFLGRFLLHRGLQRNFLCNKKRIVSDLPFHQKQSFCIVIFTKLFCNLFHKNHLSNIYASQLVLFVYPSSSKTYGIVRHPQQALGFLIPLQSRLLLRPINTLNFFCRTRFHQKFFRWFLLCFFFRGLCRF